MRDLSLKLWIIALVTLGCSGSDPAAALDGGTAADAHAEAAASDGFTEPDRPGIDVASTSDAGGAVDASPQDLGSDASSDGGTCAGRSQCGTDCTDLANDVAHCGSCSTDCRALPGVHADAVRCVAGACVLTGACVVGRGDCDRDAQNGCEADLTTPAVCGRCGVSCGDPRPLCSMLAGTDGGTADYLCASGCTGMTADRCGVLCVDLLTDTRHCGSCGHACLTTAHGSAVCVAGACRIECASGFHRCGDVCVADASIEACGSSCTRCAAPPTNGMVTCTSGACGFTCNTGFHRCGDACVSNTSPSSCGSACSPCAVVTNGTATCDGTSCGVSCNAGFHHCGTSCLSDTSTDSCGSSCTPCTAPFNAVATCAGTAPTCGFRCGNNSGNCDGDATNGCELRLTSVTNCGACGNVCPAVGAHAVSYCLYQGPDMPARCATDCESGWVDCDSNVANGCEAMGACFVDRTLLSDDLEATPSRWTVTNGFLRTTSTNCRNITHCFGCEHCLATVAALGSCPNEATATLTEEYDFSRVVSGTFTFYSLGSAGSTDSTTLQVSTDGGSTWSSLPSGRPCFCSSNSAPATTVDLSTVAGARRVRFRFSWVDRCDDRNASQWLVDDIALRVRERTYGP